MSYERDVMEVALAAGRTVLMQAYGSPARTLAGGVAAGIVAVGVGLGYGAAKYGQKFWDWATS